MRSQDKKGISDTKVAMGVMVVSVLGSLLFFTIFSFTDVKDRIISAKQPVVYAQSDGQTDNGVDKTQPDSTDVESDEGLEEDAGDTTDSTGDSPLSTGSDEIEINQDDLVLFLDGLSDEEFQGFVEGVLEQSTSKDMLDLRKQVVGKTLEEAYKEAEELYPGKIDGSKRLALIAELNAIDFMYYVVEQGDTLGELSKSLSVPMGQLVESNGIHDADMIRIGEILLVPTDEIQ